MSINRTATAQRNVEADERRIRDTGLASGAVGEALLIRYTTPLAQYLENVMAKRPTAYRREMDSLTPEIYDALQGIRKETIAAAMLRGCINCHHIVGQDAPPEVYTAMGDELQTEARGVAVRAAMKQKLGKKAGAKEFARLRKLFSRQASMRKKSQAEYAVLRAHAIRVDPWPRDLQAHVGMFACDMLLRALPDVIAVDDYDLPRMSKEAAEAVNINLYAHPVYEPSADPPYPWFSFDGIEGDTFVANCRDEEAVREAIARGVPHVDAVNYLQSIGFRINEHTLDVVKRRHLLKKVKSDGDETLLEQNIDMADCFRGLPFYIPLRVDFRGRLIAGPNLNYATPDHIRGLFKFDRTAPITKDGLRWLKIACATSFDDFHEGRRVSKQTFDKRLEWTGANIERIREAGREPLKHLQWLGEADEPIQCAALFNELDKAIEEGPSYACSVPIGLDASNSGLQHFAVLARNSKTARLTNLVPTEEGPLDIYDFILSFVQTHLAIYAKEVLLAKWWLDGRLDRKIIKKLVMTYGYSAKEWGQKSGVYQELRRRREDIPDGAVAALVKLVRQAIETHIPAAPAVMTALQAPVTADAPVSWVSPSGLPVANSYQRSKTKRVEHYQLGRKKRSVIGVEWQPGQRVDKCKSAIAPNYVHSMDSAHLALVANECAREGIPLVTIHDSFNTLPCHVTRLRQILMEQLRSMYANYEALVPPTGDLDLDEVTGPYAFS
jgi:DNA-directed RNA polymerase